MWSSLELGWWVLVLLPRLVRPNLLFNKLILSRFRSSDFFVEDCGIRCQSKCIVWIFELGVFVWQTPVERTTETLEKVPEMRVSTLTPSSVKLVQRCGAWEELAPPNSAAVEQMQVSQSTL